MEFAQDQNFLCGIRRHFVALSGIPKFAGVLNDGGQTGSVKGMSGGPILGVSRTVAVRISRAE